MKRLLMMLLVATMFGGITTAQNVSFKFEDGTLANAALRQKMEYRISRLLSELTKATATNHQLTEQELTALNLTPVASKRLSKLWENLHFACDYTSNVEKCLRDVNGYEVRGVMVTLQPTADNYKGSTSRELAISFAPDGFITGVNMTIENNSYQDILNNGKDVTDTRRRLEILKFVEDFRSYYDEKDLEALKNIYSEDALIITGKVVEVRDLGSDQARMKPEIMYSKLNKEQYMSRLATTFKKNKFIKVKFDDIKVKKHGAKEGFYAVTLRQDWQSSTYSDNGYVFLLWEFKEGCSPIVHVRTWQPEMVGNKKLDPDDVFTENDFFIP